MTQGLLRQLSVGGIEGRNEGDLVGDPLGEVVATDGDIDGVPMVGEELKVIGGAEIGATVVGDPVSGTSMGAGISTCEVVGAAVVSSPSSSALATEIAASNATAKRVRSFMVTSDHLSKFSVLVVQVLDLSRTNPVFSETAGENHLHLRNEIMCESYGFAF